jgi:hypothetical protein
MPSKIPLAMSAPKALLSRLPQNSKAVRWPSSLRLYHFESKNNAPGKNAASTKPKKNRVMKTPVKLVQYQISFQFN